MRDVLPDPVGEERRTSARWSIDTAGCRAYPSNMTRIIFLGAAALVAAACGDDDETRAKGDDGSGGAAATSASSAVTTGEPTSTSSASGAGTGGDAASGGGGSGGQAPATPGLTLEERAWITEQVAYEIDHMGFIANTARATGEHILINRLPFSWAFFTLEMFCPEGCQSGESVFPPWTAFRTFDPEEASYEYVWTGAMGTLEGTADFELAGLPAQFLDTDSFEPNDDSLYVVREHVEHVDIVPAETDDDFVFRRIATKDFDIVLDEQVVRMAHTDETTLEGTLLEDGFVDAGSVHYEARFTALREDGELVVEVDVDTSGAASGEVRWSDELIATVTGQASPDAVMLLEVAWTTGPDEPPASCEAECGDRVCGREPACGRACGACDEGLFCGPLGACLDDPLD
jgi:hypothetical protein